MDKLRAISVQGLPEEGRLRCTVWKLLLRYLPTDGAEWEEYTNKRRILYKQLRNEFELLPILNDTGSADSSFCCEEGDDEHPSSSADQTDATAPVKQQPQETGETVQDEVSEVPAASADIATSDQPSTEEVLDVPINTYNSEASRPLTSFKCSDSTDEFYMHAGVYTAK